MVGCSIMTPNRFYCSALDECRVALGKLSIFNLWYFKKQLSMQLIVSKERQVERLHQKKMYLTSEVKKLEKQKSELLDIDEDSMGFGDLW